MAERLGNLGYFGLIKEATKGVPLAPTDWIPMYKESMDTDIALVEDNPVFGNKFARYGIWQGSRSHRGDVEIMAEPNTIARVVDMLLTKGTTTGAGPFTHPFTLSATTNPNSYTVDISTGNLVSRFWGVEASKISPKFDKNEMHMQVSLSALGSFQGRQITSVATTTLTLDATYDPSPSTGLVANDLVRLWNHTTGATSDFTVASITNGTTVVLNATAAAFGVGDMIYLRPATPSFNNLTPFLWTNTQFCFGATAAAALSATQTRVESGSEWSMLHMFESDAGAQRSGAFDPAALVRTQGDATLKIKKFFDQPSDMQTWEQISKTACVVRHYSGLTNQYELRITFNNLKIKSGVNPDTETSKILYSELELSPMYDSSDAQAVDVKVFNNLATV